MNFIGVFSIRGLLTLNFLCFSVEYFSVLLFLIPLFSLLLQSKFFP